MSEINELVDKHAKETDIIAKIAKQYWARVKKSALKYVDAHDMLDSAFALMSSEPSYLEKNAKLSTALVHLAYIYAREDTIIAALREMDKLYYSDNVYPRVIAGMSGSYVSDIQDNRALFSTRFAKYKWACSEFNDEVFRVFATTYDITASQEVVDFIEGTIPANINTFHLRLVNVVGARLRGVARERLFASIEAAKKSILAAEYRTIPGHDATVLSHPYRLGFVPATLSMDTADLMAEIGLSDIITPAPECFVELATRAGVIVLYNITNNPIEYNVRGLIDMNYIIKHNLIIEQFAGITERVIKKYATAVKLERGTAIPAKSINVYNESADVFYVFESINGIHYRALSLNRSMVISRKYIAPFLTGFSTLPLKYGEIVFSNESDYIDEHIKPKIEAFEREHITEKVGEDLKIVFRRVVMQYIEDNLREPITKAELAAIITQEYLVKTFIDMLVMKVPSSLDKSDYHLSAIAKATEAAKTAAKMYEDSIHNLNLARIASTSAHGFRELLAHINEIITVIIIDLESQNFWESYNHIFKLFYQTYIM